MTTPTPEQPAAPEHAPGGGTAPLPRGAGLTWDSDEPAPAWGGKRAQQFTQLTLETYGRTCWLCGLPGATSCDHVIARSRGGHPYDLRNAAPAHGRCNYARGNRDVIAADQIVESSVAFF